MFLEAVYRLFANLKIVNQVRHIDPLNLRSVLASCLSLPECSLKFFLFVMPSYLYQSLLMMQVVSISFRCLCRRDIVAQFTVNLIQYCRPNGNFRRTRAVCAGWGYHNCTARLHSSAAWRVRQRTGRLCGWGLILRQGGGGKVPCSTYSKEQSLFLSGLHSTARHALDFCADLRPTL